jgi:hypothetical protein
MTSNTHPNAIYRQLLLRKLYAAREARPAAGWMNLRDLGAAVLPPAGACTDIDFAVGVLAELGHVTVNGFDLRITGAGVLACEAAWG